MSIPKAPGAPLPSVSRARASYIRTYDAGRVCREPGCVTALSRYNEGQLCWCHAGERLGITPTQPRPTLPG